MQTMPPEMSTAATPTVALTPTPAQSLTSAVALQSSARSRFMITDILAGAAAAANSQRSSPSSSPPAGPTTVLHQHLHGFHGAPLPPHHAHHQQQIALQHYLAQQQHLLQQHHQQQQQQHGFQHGSPPPPTSGPTTHHPQHAHSHPSAHHPLSSHHATAGGGPNGGPPPPAHPHPALAHLPPNALIGFGPATHYAVLQQERERLRELEHSNGIGGVGGGILGSRGEGIIALDHDDRSRSPNVITSSGMGNGVISVRDLSTSGGNVGGGGGGGGSSISGDQASTIDDSDSDTCGAKDDDGNGSIKGDNLMGLNKKQRKARTAFTDHQLQTLEKSFERQKYLSVQDRMELANKLELSDCQVKTWYQNRRTKWKRQTAVGLELLAEAGNYAAFQRLYGGSPYLSAWPYAQTPHGAPASAIDLYYRQAAAAAALQKPLSYRMYPSVPPMGMPPTVGPTPTMLTATNPLTSLSSYYQGGGGGVGGGVPNPATGLPPTHISPLSPDPSDVTSEKLQRSSSVDLMRTTTPSPQLNPGSPPERLENVSSSCTPPSDEEIERERRMHELRHSREEDDDEDDAAIEV